MRRLLPALLILLSGCTLIPRSDSELSGAMATSLESGDYRQAHDHYSRLSKAAREEKRVKQLYRKLRQAIASIRTKTRQESMAALASGDWKRALDLYRDREELVEIDRAFEQDYRDLTARQRAAARKLNIELLALTADYLIEAIRVRKNSVRISPYDYYLPRELDDLEYEAQAISEQLLEYGRTAIDEKDIATARRLIPLAGRLDRNPESKRLAQQLDRLLEPLGQHVEDLIRQANQLYNSEQYQEALTLWNEVLEIDPNNREVRQQRERTLTVLDSLKRIEHENRSSP